MDPKRQLKTKVPSVDEKRKKFPTKKKRSFLKEEKPIEDAPELNTKKVEDEKNEKSMKMDGRQLWCEKILRTRVFAINKEFIANKSIKPKEYTTEAYNRNEPKNRYDDILCIDATRVILKDRPPEDDYIHANWMTMPDGHKYICTQGPVQATIEDFWHMIYMEKSPVIVMLTALEDDGKVAKCSRYYPLDSHEIFNQGQYKVMLKESKKEPSSKIKWNVLKVAKDGGEPFLVNQFIYDTWTDHTAPESAAPAVALFRLTRKLAEGYPVTVHCSAGIGRTATFVGMDYGSQKIANHGEQYSMIELIKDLRSQRFHSIQSPTQYLFLHLCILELFAEEGYLPRTEKYTNFLASYQRLLKRFAEKNKKTKKENNE